MYDELNDEALKALESGEIVIFYKRYKGAEMPKSTKPNLKPCPFCANPAYERKDYDGKYFIGCKPCDILFSGYRRYIVVSRWNRRKEPEVAKKSVKTVSERIVAKAELFIPELDPIQDRFI